jgi:hypothetical protein
MTKSPEFCRRVDELLASALRGNDPPWPAKWHDAAVGKSVVARTVYHGLAALLVKLRPTGWPAAVVEGLREEAMAQSMWEMQHRLVLADLLTGLAAADVSALVLKGTGIAYDLYDVPSERARADTDILVRSEELSACRRMLASKGYVRDPRVAGLADDVLFQEIWQLECRGGTRHDIDLHWQALNAPALEGVLPFDQCLSGSMPLPRLCADARTLDHVHMFIHTALHRAAHLTTPYVSGDAVFYGGDRLIWAQDLQHLIASFSQSDWRRMVDTALDNGVAAVCLDALTFVRAQLHSVLPEAVIAELRNGAHDTRATRYLRESRQSVRAAHDFLAIGGWRRRWAYLMARTVPSPAFIRSKYPAMASAPLPLLYLRRGIELFRKRPGS